MRHWMILVSLVALAGCGGSVRGETGATESAKPEARKAGDNNMDTATFAAGCFWGVEAAFREVEGVISTRVGYTGGHAENPTYKQVCTGKTGHAEAVEVTYDPSKVSYEDLLDVFWNAHDPTQVNRQGPDTGEQYRSGIFYHNDAQKAAAEKSRQNLGESARFRKPIATKLTAATTFWPAEDYHQQYLEKRGLTSCHIGVR